MVIVMAAWRLDRGGTGGAGGRPARKVVVDVKRKVTPPPQGIAGAQGWVGLEVGVSVVFTKMTRRRGGLGDIGSLGPVRGDPLATFVPMLGAESLGLQGHHVSGPFREHLGRGGGHRQSRRTCPTVGGG